MLCAGLAVGKGVFMSEEQMRSPQVCSMLLHVGERILDAKLGVAGSSGHVLLALNIYVVLKSWSFLLQN